MRFGIIGAGIWGSVFADYLAKNHYKVLIWAYEESVKKSINNKNINEIYFKGHSLNKNIEATRDLEEIISKSDVLINAVPVQYMSGVWDKVRIPGDKILINLSKGIEIDTLNFPYDILKKNSECPIYILSGPSFAKEVYQEIYTTVVLSGEINRTARKIQDVLSSNYFRVYLNNDILGVEIAAALKNVIAIASGIVDGMNLGKNTQSAIITRGVAEVSRLGKKMGAKLKTFSGLAGFGDFILTCTDKMSRNYNFGYLLSKKNNLDEALENAGGVVEGYYTVKNARALSKKYEIDMPITESVYRIIYKNVAIQSVVEELMSRELKNEFWGMQ